MHPSPVFELINLPADAAVPVLGRELITELGVPRRLIGAEYEALDEARLILVDSVGGLVAFGSSGLQGRVCLDLESLAIVHLPDETGRIRNIVNADLGKFIECCRVVVERFPFYDDDAEFDECEQVADELADAVLAIDESALAHDGFWGTFLDDVRIGDYAAGLIPGRDDKLG